MIFKEQSNVLANEMPITIKEKYIIEVTEKYHLKGGNSWFEKSLKV